MSVGHALLGTLAAVVFGGAVYLFVQVRSSPAAPQPRTAIAKADEASRDDEASRGESRPSKSDRVTRNTRVTRGPTGLANPNTTQPTPDAPDASATQNLVALMAEANKAYDRHEYDEAKAIATKVLTRDPTSARMLRILVSVACIDHDPAEAQKQYNRLTKRSDRDAMRLRCQRDYGIVLVEPPLSK